MWHMACLWRSEDKCVEFHPSYFHMDPKEGGQALSLALPGNTFEVDGLCASTPG